MRHHSHFIKIYMGKLRFTLTNIIFWIVLMLSCFLSENFAIFNTNPMGGFAFDTSLILTISIIGLLVFYYFLEHKKNNLKFDIILLPSLIVSGLLMIWTVIRQNSCSLTDPAGNLINITISNNEKLMAIFQIVIWLSVIYALVFVYNRFRLNKESYRWVAKVYLFAILTFTIIDLFLEGNKIGEILNGTYVGGGLSFLMGNANVWALLLFAGMITCLLLLFKRFRWYYYVGMIAFFLYGILTTCATTIYIGIIAIPAYTLYEIFSHYKENKRQSLIHLAVFVGVILTIVSSFSLFVAVKIPIFVNIWHFLEASFLNKNFLTFTGRITIWQRIFELLSQNPLDFIFGLGHKTGQKIFFEYMATTYNIRSAHNAVMEMLLRYGLLGMITYLGILALVVYALVLRLKKKQYRFVAIYGLAFLCIMAHAFTESTTLFTPNVGGLYFSFVFVLPIVNIVQEKRFASLKEELINAQIDESRLNKNSFLNGFVLLVLAIVLTSFINHLLAIDSFSTILVLIAILLIMIIIILISEHYRKYKPITIINNKLLGHYQELVRKEESYEK